MFDDFIGKVIISDQTNRRYTLYQITSSYIDVKSIEPNESGYHPHYRFEFMSKDPITEGRLCFEDVSLKESFIKVFNDYSHSKEAYWEDYGYWMRKD